MDEPEEALEADEPAVYSGALRAKFRCAAIMPAAPRALSPAATPASSPERNRALATIDLAAEPARGGALAPHLLPPALPPLEEWLEDLGAGDMLGAMRENGYDTGPQRPSHLPSRKQLLHTLPRS
eukprot:COSAG04_NODE_358_length_16025_cov_193.915610_6_plen_125_part_00